MEKEDKIAQVLVVLAISAFLVFFMYGMYSHKKYMDESHRDLSRRLDKMSMSSELTKKRDNLEKAAKSKIHEERKLHLLAAEENQRKIDEFEKKWPGLMKELRKYEQR